jgi:uncharacterized membrane protein YhfC
VNILNITYPLNSLLMIAIPIALGIYLVRKLELEGRWWWIGAAVFLLSQAGRLPFENYIICLNTFNSSGILPSTGVLIVGALVFGLSAALWEELFRYSMFRWLIKDARSWASGLVAGAGHGGAEAIILGMLALYNLVNMSLFRNADPSYFGSADQAAAFQAVINTFWSAPWYSTLLGILERLFALAVQICFALLVLQTFVRRQRFWVWLAVGFHTLTYAITLIAQNLLSIYFADAIMGIFAILSIVIIFALKRSEVVPTIPVDASSL